MQQNPVPSTKKTGPKQASIGAGILFLLIGIALVAFAVYSNNVDIANFDAEVTPVPTGTPADPNPNAPVTCNNEPMNPGEECDHILTIDGSSSTTTYSYDEQKAYQSEARIEQVATQRENERAAQGERKRPFFTPLGCLSEISCLIGLILAFMALGFFRGRSLQRKKAQQPQPAQTPPSAGA